MLNLLGYSKGHENRRKMYKKHGQIAGKDICLRHLHNDDKSMAKWLIAPCPNELKPGEGAPVELR